MIANIGFLNDRFFSLSFPYNAGLVSRVRKLGRRRWNPKDKRWEVHIEHLDDVMRIFSLQPEQVDPKVRRLYKINRIRNYRTRVQVDNVNATILGSHLPLQKIDEATSFFVSGHQYMPRFQAGRWDGKRHLFDKKTHRFPSGLLSRVTAILQADGIEHEVRISDGTKPSLKTQKPGLELRPYQRACVKAALEVRRGVLELATGSGKTAVAAYLIHKLQRPALFVVHTRDLLYQTLEVFREHLQVPIGQVGDGVIDVKPITVATVQTCAKAMNIKVFPSEDEEALEQDETEVGTRAEDIQEFVRTCAVVFFDECHHLPADCCFSLAMHTEGAEYRFGLSATPYRADRHDLLLEAAIGPKVYQANASLLISKGYLVPPQIRFLAVPAYRSAHKAADYQSIFDQYIVKNPARNRMIADEAQKLADRGKSVLILVSQVRHGEKLRELLKNAPLLQGSDPPENRRTTFLSLEQKKRHIVIATTLADEGLDIPSLDAVILASGGKSETRALQRLGRALRPSPNKEIAVVIDFFDNAPFLKEHSLRRLQIYQTEPEFRIDASGISV